MTLSRKEREAVEIVIDRSRQTDLEEEEEEEEREEAEFKMEFLLVTYPKKRGGRA